MPILVVGVVLLGVRVALGVSISEFSFAQVVILWLETASKHRVVYCVVLPILVRETFAFLVEPCQVALVLCFRDLCREPPVVVVATTALLDKSLTTLILVLILGEGRSFAAFEAGLVNTTLGAVVLLS